MSVMYDSNLEDPKDFLDRAESHPEFRRFLWQMRFSRLLAEKGFQNIELFFDPVNRRWHFTMGWGTFWGSNTRLVERAINFALFRFGRQLAGGRCRVTADEGLLIGSFRTEVRVRENLPDHHANFAA